MNLRYLLLGLLSRKPGSGYSLHKRFFVPLRPVISQVYRALNEMFDEGLVEVDRIDDGKLPIQKVYRITETGLNVLDHWLSSSIEPKLGRDMFTSQLWFSSRIGKEQMINKLNLLSESVRKQISKSKVEFRKKIKKASKSPTNELDEFFWNLTTDYVLMQLESYLLWTNNAIRKLSSSDSPDTHSQTHTVDNKLQMTKKRHSRKK